MKKLLILVALGALALPAVAQTAPEEVQVRGNVIELPARPYLILSEDLGQYRGAYELANGQLLSIGQVGRRMYAKLDNGERHELVAAASNVFVARDRSLKITLVPDPAVDYTGEVLIRNTDMPLASAVTSVRLVSAR